MGKRSTFTRAAADKYRTTFKATLPLVPYIERGATFAELCAGDGRLVRHMQRHGLRCVHMSDLYPDDLLMTRADALQIPLPECDYLLTNPPWSRWLLHPMIDRFRRHAPTWLLFDAGWMFTAQSAPYMKYCEMIVAVGRVRWIDGTTQDGKDDSAWYKFVNHETHTRIIGR